jgi:predicted RNA-binding protein with PIN domain
MNYSSPAAILLVDGYNAIGQWPTLRKTKKRAGLEAARWELIQTLTNYSAVQEYETQIVFDAQYRKQRSPLGNREVIDERLSVAYTNYGETADTFIERACALFREDIRRFQSRLIVATSDRAQQMTVVGYGAEWMSVQHLANDVDVMLTQVRQHRSMQRRTTGRLLAHCIDDAARQQLSRWRHGLS